MLFTKERELIIYYGKKLKEYKLTIGTSGNISIFIRDKKLVLITPSGIDYDEINLEDIVLVDLEGKIIEGTKKPSSELTMHLIFYNNRNDINALVHVHSLYATILACMNMDLPALHYIVGTLGGVDVRCSKYATFGSRELAENAFAGMKDRFAVLLANHGLLTGGKDLVDAFNKTLDVEFCSELYCKAKTIGKPVILDNEEMNKVIKEFSKYGQVKE